MKSYSVLSILCSTNLFYSTPWSKTFLLKSSIPTAVLVIFIVCTFLNLAPNQDDMNNVGDAKEHDIK